MCVWNGKAMATIGEYKIAHKSTMKKKDIFIRFSVTWKPMRMWSPTWQHKWIILYINVADGLPSKYSSQENWLHSWSKLLYNLHHRRTQGNCGKTRGVWGWNWIAEQGHFQCCLICIKCQLTEGLTENKSAIGKHRRISFPALSASCRQETAPLQAYGSSL